MRIVLADVSVHMCDAYQAYCGDLPGVEFFGERRVWNMLDGTDSVRRTMYLKWLVQFDYDLEYESKNAVSFTGHRPERLGGYDSKHPKNQKVIEFLRKAIAKARDDGFEEFISGGALGVDQWAAEVVLELGLKLVIALPFAKYGENWPVESQAHLAFLKSKASKVEIVCEGEYFENGKAQTWKNHERNKWMMNNSELIIAVGLPAQLKVERRPARRSSASTRIQRRKSQ